MRKLLYITAFPPNRKSGGQTFSLNALKDLSNKYSIDLIYFTYPNHKVENLNNVHILKEYTPRVIGCLLMPIYHPLFTRRFSISLLNYINSISANYDVIYFDYIQCAIYSIFVKHPNKVIRCHDIVQQKYEREKRLLVHWIKRGENVILKSANQIFVPSEKDADYLLSKYQLRATFTNEYLPKFRIADDIEIDDKFILFGLWSRYENLDGLKWFLNTVYYPNKELLNKKITVMGGGMSSEFRKKYLDPFGIQYLGYVENSYQEIVKYAAMIVPLFQGAGIKIKVLDSFNTGTPVIGTSIAFEGLKSIEGLTYIVETPEEFLNTMLSFCAPTKEEKQKFKDSFENCYGQRGLADYL